MKNEFGAFHLLFRGSVMLINFAKPLKPYYTNFFRSVSIDQRDIIELENRLQKVISLAGAVLPLLD